MLCHEVTELKAGLLTRHSGAVFSVGERSFVDLFNLTAVGKERTMKHNMSTLKMEVVVNFVSRVRRVVYIFRGVL